MATLWLHYGISMGRVWLPLANAMATSCDLPIWFVTFVTCDWIRLTMLWPIDCFWLSPVGNAMATVELFHYKNINVFQKNTKSIKFLDSIPKTSGIKNRWRYKCCPEFHLRASWGICVIYSVELIYILPVCCWIIICYVGIGLTVISWS